MGIFAMAFTTGTKRLFRNPNHICKEEINTFYCNLEHSVSNQFN